MHKFFIFQGEGANGKGVAMKALAALVGPENVSHVGIEQFGERFGLQPTIGKLVNIVNEIDRPRDLAEGTLKAFTAGDRISIDRKHRDPVEMYPTARLVATTNQWPDWRDKSGGIMRRLIPLHFAVIIPEEKMVRNLAEQFMLELPGIFNWALAGLRRLRAQGEFTLPESSRALLEEMRPRRDGTADRFLQDHCVTDVETFTPTEELYAAYKEWCRAENVPALTDAQFGQALRQNFPGAKSKRGGGPRRPYGYLGVRLNPQLPEEAPHEVASNLGSLTLNSKTETAA